MTPEPHERPCDECRVIYPRDCLRRSDVFGVRLVCLECERALEDEGVYEMHADEEGAGVCDCRECRRHRDRCFRKENAQQLKLGLREALARMGESDGSDIDF